MKKIFFLTLLCLFSTWNIGGQTNPPPGTQSITLKVKPNQEFKLGLIAREGATEAWVELDGQNMKAVTIGSSPTVPTVFNFTSTSGNVKVYGSFHIFGCPANGEIITELDATGYTPLEQLYCNNNSITKLSVERCSNLTTLSCSENPLDTLDVTSCQALKDLACFKNGLKGIDLTQNKHLIRLQCPENIMTRLDLTANEELQEVHAGKNQLETIKFPKKNAIHLLYAYENKLNTLDLSSLPLLDDVDIYDNRLESLDLSACPKIESLDCSENHIGQLDVTASKDVITSLSCSDNEISELEIAGCKDLNYVNASNNKLTSLLLDNLPNLEKIYLYGNQLEVLDAQDCTSLSTLSLNDNAMYACSLNNLFNSLATPTVQGKLQIGGNPGAATSTTTLAVQKNWNVDVTGDGTGCSSGTVDAPPAGTPVIKLATKPGSTISVTMRVYSPDMFVWIESTPGTFKKEAISYDYDNPSVFSIACPGDSVKLYSNVADFSCSKNGDAITAVDASNNPELGTLYCHENAITTLNVSGCPYLMDLSCGKNQIKKLDLTGINYLQYLFCYENQLDELNLSHCKSIEELECSSNNISVLDLSHMSRATTIMCHTNNIKELNLSSCKKLTEFSCANNQLTTLNMDSCQSLLGFSCGSNQLSKLDVTKCEKLNRLFCSVNRQLEQVIIKPQSALQQFSAMECALKNLDLSQLPQLTKALLSHNPLQEITINGCPKLNNLAIDHCEISACEMNQLFQELPTVAQGELKIAENPDVAGTKTETATAKGWTADVKGDGTGCASSVTAINQNTIVIAGHESIEVMTPVVSQVAIYDIAGHQVAHFTTEPLEPVSIQVQASRAYIVSINGRAQKVYVK